MDLTFEDLVDALGAKAYAFPPDEPGVLLVSHEDDMLCEAHRVRSENGTQRFITEDVPESTSAVYIWDKDTRWIYCRDREDALVRYTYNFARRTWDPVPIPDPAPDTIHPDSRLGGCLMQSTCHVIFHDSSGHLQGISTEDDGTSSEPLFSVPVVSKPGSPLFAAVRNDALCVWHFDPDNHLHCLVQTAKGAEWQDNEVPGASFPDIDIKSFMCIFDTNGGFQTIALSDEQDVWTVDQQGKRTLLGTVTRGRFKAASSAENFIMAVADVADMVKAGSKKVKEWREEKKKG